MTDDHEEKTIRLLNIIDRIVSIDESESPAQLPFIVDQDGVLTLSDALHSELTKQENSDLRDWAQHHITSLFE